MHIVSHKNIERGLRQFRRPRLFLMSCDICPLKIQNGSAEPVLILNTHWLEGAAAAVEPLVGDLRGPANLHGE